MRPTEQMPTAGRLVASIGMGALAWYAAGIVMLLWPDDIDFGKFQYFSTAIAIVMGWRVVGTRLGNGLLQGMGAGLTALFALVFWLFLLLSFYEMIQRSLDLRYDGPFEAFQGMFGIAYEYLLNVLHLRLAYLLVGGSLLVGLVSELVSRKFS